MALDGFIPGNNEVHRNICLNFIAVNKIAPYCEIRYNRAVIMFSSYRLGSG